MDTSHALAANRDLWGKRVRAHLRHGLYPSARVESGTYELTEPEISEVGDVAGRSLVHLQCNAGADTLAWARRGARVTGIDFSAVAITEAQRLAAATGIDASFVCADLFELDASSVGQFDIAYTSMGVLWWLPDLGRWATLIADLLVPGGAFYIHEIHPFAACLRDEDGATVVGFDYFPGAEPVVFETSGTYYDAPPDFEAEPAMEHGHVHAIGEVVTSLISAGLRIEWLHEHASSTFGMLPSLVLGDDGRWTWPDGAPRVPLTFSLLAHRP